MDDSPFSLKVKSVIEAASKPEGFAAAGLPLLIWSWGSLFSASLLSRNVVKRLTATDAASVRSTHISSYQKASLLIVGKNSIEGANLQQKIAELQPKSVESRQKSPCFVKNR